MEILDAKQTADRLGYAELANSIREVMVRRRSGELEAPPRLTPGLPEGGTLLVMPAADEEIALTKLVTVHPENSKRNLPTIQGEVVVMDARTGVRLGILEGGTVTARRTAALSLLAAQTLAKMPDGPLLIVGAGTQATAHLEAFREGLGVSKVFIVSRTDSRAEALADYARPLGMEAAVAGEVEDVLDEVSLIVTATTSHEPVLPEEIPPDKFVAAVGAFNPEMAELPSALLSESTVAVDTLEGVKEEAGDLIQAEKAGAFNWDRAVQLEDALQWTSLPDGPIVFKSVGDALWDLAAARAVFSHS
ncbi:delta(1)-pyrroline-2-carboxylate reductase family protein [soil metagenome]